MARRELRRIHAHRDPNATRRVRGHKARDRRNCEQQPRALAMGTGFEDAAVEMDGADLAHQHGRGHPLGAELGRSEADQDGGGHRQHCPQIRGIAPPRRPDSQDEPRCCRDDGPDWPGLPRQGEIGPDPSTQPYRQPQRPAVGLRLPGAPQPWPDGPQPDMRHRHRPFGQRKSPEKR